MVSTKQGFARVVFGGCILATIVACSGGISTVGGDGGAGSSGAGSSGASGGSSGTSGGDSACSVAETVVTRACVPGTAAPGVAITVQAEGEDTGCLGCGKSLEPCSVQVVGQKITIGLSLKTCSLPPDTACPAICAVGVGTCTIPPLAEGTYSIELAGGAKTSGDIARQLVVKSGGASSCTLDQGTNPPTIEADGYADSCSGDQDCALVIEGNVCQPCGCPNEAIAKSALDAFQAELRAKKSLCKDPSGGGPACAACPAYKATCAGGKCVSVMTPGGG